MDEKMLTYFSNYFQALVLHNNTNSVGRIPKYIPLLNSNLPVASGATQVSHVNDAATNVYATPSRNVEVMSDFLIGIMTNKGLSNRSDLRLDKVKAIREKTYLCTFKSTTEYSMNYETLLKRLYYKFPCYLTPSIVMSSEEINTMEIAVITNAVGFELGELFETAISECKEMKAYNVICAIGIAMQIFIRINFNLEFNRDEALHHLRQDIDFGNGAISANPDSLNQIVSDALNNLVIHGRIEQHQLNPLIGAAIIVSNE